jgi:hypothetical protein
VSSIGRRRLELAHTASERAKEREDDSGLVLQNLDNRFRARIKQTVSVSATMVAERGAPSMGISPKYAPRPIPVDVLAPWRGR